MTDDDNFDDEWCYFIILIDGSMTMLDNFSYPVAYIYGRNHCFCLHKPIDRDTDCEAANE